MNSDMKIIKAKISQIEIFDEKDIKAPEYILGRKTAINKRPIVK